MSVHKILSSIFIYTAKAFLSVDEKTVPDHSVIKNVLIVRQHNQFGDLLASVSLFRAVKETFINCKLTVITSPQNCYAVSKNKYIDEQFVFDKKKLFNPDYIYRLLNLLRGRYDLVIVPVTVAISDTSCFIGRFAHAGYRIGPGSLNGKINELSFLFHKSIDMNWDIKPERHVSDFGLDIVRLFGINTDNFKSEISFDKYDEKTAEEFLNSISTGDNKLIIGFHIGAGKPPNRWPVDKFISLAELINENYNADFYLTGSSSDENELNQFCSSSKIKCNIFLNKKIPEVAALISKSSLFITNDTGVMHVAGATNTAQISLFGPTNPNNWAPIGVNKLFIKQSDSINEIAVKDVFNSVQKLLSK